MFFQVKNHCNLYEYFIIEMKNTKYAFHLLLCAANKLKLILIINELQFNYPFYLDEYMSNVEADLEFSKAIDVRLMQCVHISIFMFYASIEET